MADTQIETATAPPHGAPHRKRRRRRRLRRRLRPLRHWIVFRCFLLFAWLCPRLSHRAVLRLGRALGRLGFALARGERRKALRNLELAFGAEMPPEGREAVAREAFESVAMTAAEALHSARWNPEYYRAVIEFEGDEHARAALAPGMGSLYITAHLGNWELMPPAYLYHSGIAAGVIMRDMRNARLSEMIKLRRGSRGNKIYSTEESALSLIRALKKGGVISLLADQDTRRLRGIHVEFFGRPARTPVGPAILAKKTGASILPAFMHRRRDDPTRHVLRFHPPIFPDPALDEETDARRMLQDYTRALEEEIRAEPGQWAWMHERWKHGKG